MNTVVNKIYEQFKMTNQWMVSIQTGNWQPTVTLFTRYLKTNFYRKCKRMFFVHFHIKI